MPIAHLGYNLFLCGKLLQTYHYKPVAEASQLRQFSTSHEKHLILQVILKYIIIKA